MQLLRKNEIFHDRFQIIECLGEGGMGAVYHALQLDCDREVAIKILKPELTPDETNRLRFKRECRILSELNSPHIPAFFHYSVSGHGVCYCVHELLQGESLSKLIKRRGKLPAREVVPIVQQVCLALKAAHDNGVVHRDLKPDNIMLLNVPEPGFVKLLDFGLSHTIDPEISQKLTATGHLLGTANYMSPEQCRGAAIDKRSDIYSLGCTIYECLAGQAPFDADTAIGVLYKHQNQDATTLCDALSDRAPSKLIEILKKTLEKNPDNRPQSVDELMCQIQNINLDDLGSRKEVSAGKKSTSGLIPIIAVAAIALLCGAIFVSKYLKQNEASSIIQKEDRDLREFPRDAKLLRDRVHAVSITPAVKLRMLNAWIDKYAGSPMTKNEEKLVIYTELAHNARTRDEFKIPFDAGVKVMNRLGTSAEEIDARMRFLAFTFPESYIYKVGQKLIEAESIKAVRLVQEHDVDFDLIEPCRNVASTLISLNYNQEAIDLIEAFLRQHKEHLEYFPSTGGKMIFTLGDAFIAMGKSEEAVASYNRSLELLGLDCQVKRNRVVSNPDNSSDIRYIYQAERFQFLPLSRDKCLQLALERLKLRNGGSLFDLESAVELYQVAREMNVEKQMTDAFRLGSKWVIVQSRFVPVKSLRTFLPLLWEDARFLYKNGESVKAHEEYKFVHSLSRKLSDVYLLKNTAELIAALFESGNSSAARRIMAENHLSYKVEWDHNTPASTSLAYPAIAMAAWADGKREQARKIWELAITNCTSREITEMSLDGMIRCHQYELARELYTKATKEPALVSSENHAEKYRGELALRMGTFLMRQGKFRDAEGYFKEGVRCFAAIGDPINYGDRALPITRCYLGLLQCKLNKGEARSAGTKEISRK